MPHATKTHVVKISGVSDDPLSLINQRLKSRRMRGRSAYIRELIHRDAEIPRKTSLAEILGPGYSTLPAINEDDLDEFIEDMRDEAYIEKFQRDSKAGDAAPL